jgi:mortality factor 4-like protein 1
LLKTQVKDKTVKYFIHYRNWSKNWVNIKMRNLKAAKFFYAMQDEWVPENRVLKYNESNVQMQKEIQKNIEASNKPTKKASKTTKKT